MRTLVILISLIWLRGIAIGQGEENRGDLDQLRTDPLFSVVQDAFSLQSGLQDLTIVRDVYDYDGHLVGKVDISQQLFEFIRTGNTALYYQPVILSIDGIRYEYKITPRDLAVVYLAIFEEIYSLDEALDSYPERFEHYRYYLVPNLAMKDLCEGFAVACVRISNNAAILNQDPSLNAESTTHELVHWLIQVLSRNYFSANAVQDPSGNWFINDPSAEYLAGSTMSARILSDSPSFSNTLAVEINLDGKKLLADISVNYEMMADLFDAIVYNIGQLPIGQRNRSYNSGTPTLSSDQLAQMITGDFDTDDPGDVEALLEYLESLAQAEGGMQIMRLAYLIGDKLPTDYLINTINNMEAYVDAAAEPTHFHRLTVQRFANFIESVSISALSEEEHQILSGLLWMSLSANQARQVEIQQGGYVGIPKLRGGEVDWLSLPDYVMEFLGNDAKVISFFNQLVDGEIAISGELLTLHNLQQAIANGEDIPELDSLNQAELVNLYTAVMVLFFSEQTNNPLSESSAVGAVNHLLELRSLSLTRAELDQFGMSELHRYGFGRLPRVMTPTLTEHYRDIFNTYSSQLYSRERIGPHSFRVLRSETNWNQEHMNYIMIELSTPYLSETNSSLDYLLMVYLQDDEVVREVGLNLTGDRGAIAELIYDVMISAWSERTMTSDFILNTQNNVLYNQLVEELLHLDRADLGYLWEANSQGQNRMVIAHTIGRFISTELFRKIKAEVQMDSPQIVQALDYVFDFDRDHEARGLIIQVWLNRLWTERYIETQVNGGAMPTPQLEDFVWRKWREAFLDLDHGVLDRLGTVLSPKHIGNLDQGIIEDFIEMPEVGTGPVE